MIGLRKFPALLAAFALSGAALAAEKVAIRATIVPASATTRATATVSYTAGERTGSFTSTLTANSRGEVTVAGAPAAPSDPLELTVFSLAVASISGPYALAAVQGGFTIEDERGNPVRLKADGPFTALSLDTTDEELASALETMTLKGDNGATVSDFAAVAGTTRVNGRSVDAFEFQSEEEFTLFYNSLKKCGVPADLQPGELWQWYRQLEGKPLPNRPLLTPQRLQEIDELLALIECEVTVDVEGGVGVEVAKFKFGAKIKGNARVLLRPGLIRQVGGLSIYLQFRESFRMWKKLLPGWLPNWMVPSFDPDDLIPFFFSQGHFPEELTPTQRIYAIAKLSDTLSEMPAK